jgi:hypothetical protein
MQSGGIMGRRSLLTLELDVQEDEHMVGRRVAKLPSAVYGARDYFANREMPKRKQIHRRRSRAMFTWMALPSIAVPLRALMAASASDWIGRGSQPRLNRHRLGTPSPRPDQWLKLFQTFSELLGDFLCVQHGSRQI